MVKRKIAFRKKRQNRLGMFLVLTVLVMMMVVITIRSVELKQKLGNYAEREQVLMQQITEEENRSAEIEEYRKYTKTKKYAEEVAKDKLGLVNEGEIIFKEN